MRLSIVVPTRNRSELARRCVASTLAAGHRDLQVIVLENSDQPELCSDDFGNDSRVVVLPSESPLAMHANWERGLEVVDGDYVAYLSDKDVVLPDAFGNAVKAIARSPKSHILAYRKPVYVVNAGQVIHYRATGCVTEYSAREFLTQWYHVPRHYHEMPSIYGAFVSQELIRKALAAYPRLFLGNSPDVASAAILCSLVDSWAGWEHHVSLGCYGPWSTGWTATRYGFLCENYRRFMKDYGRDISAELGLPGVLATGIVEVLLEAQAKHPQTLGGYEINWDDFLPLLRAELLALNVPKAAKLAEWARLYSGRSVAPRSAVIRCDVAWGTQRLTKLVRETLKPLVVGKRESDVPNDNDSARRMSTTSQTATQSWFGSSSGSGSIAVASLDEAVAKLAALNGQYAGVG